MCPERHLRYRGIDTKTYGADAGVISTDPTTSRTAPFWAASPVTAAAAPTRATRQPPSSRVTLTRSPGLIPAAVRCAIASGLTGIWYRWGGSSPSGFDCSGYTSYVYRKMGIRLPRTAAAQQAYARRVSQPRPGDLVFFGSPAHHVGIYAGGGMMYDSPRSGRKTQLRKIYTSRVSYGRIA